MEFSPISIVFISMGAAPGIVTEILLLAIYFTFPILLTIAMGSSALYVLIAHSRIQNHS